MKNENQITKVILGVHLIVLTINIISVKLERSILPFPHFIQSAIHTWTIVIIPLVAIGYCFRKNITKDMKIKVLVLHCIVSILQLISIIPAIT